MSRYDTFALAMTGDVAVCGPPENVSAGWKRAAVQSLSGNARYYWVLSDLNTSRRTVSRNVLAVDAVMSELVSAWKGLIRLFS
jgi:hypothetical protein